MPPCSGDMKGTPATARATASNVSSAPSRDVALERPAAGAARQGRRPAGIPLVFQGSRTPPGGDRRPPISGETLREGPLGSRFGRAWTTPADERSARAGERPHLDELLVHAREPRSQVAHVRVDSALLQREVRRVAHGASLGHAAARGNPSSYPFPVQLAERRRISAAPDT